MWYQYFRCAAFNAIVLFIVTGISSYKHCKTKFRKFEKFCSCNLLEESFSSMSDFQVLVSKTDEALLSGLKICMIARGLPGRGKTTLVENIVNHYNSIGEFTAVMAAADDFMINSSGSI